MSCINFLTLLYMSTYTFSLFAVPLFVCISGFVLYNKYTGTYSLSQFYKKRLLSVLPLYTIVTVLIVVFTYGWYIYLGRVWNINALTIFYTYVTGDWASFNPAFTPLWFFVLIIQFYIVYPVLEKIFTKCIENHRSLEFLIFLLAVQILYQVFSVKDFFLNGKATLFIGYIFYFVLGMYVRSNYQNYKDMVIIPKHFFILFSALLFATILGIGNGGIHYFRVDLIPQLILIYSLMFKIVSPLYYVVIFMVCLFLALKCSEKTPNHFTKCLKIIGNYSFGIYLVHIFILYGLAWKIFPKFGFNMNNWLFYPITFTLVLIMSLGSVYLINKIPCHEYIIGNSRY